MSGSTGSLGSIDSRDSIGALPPTAAAHEPTITLDTIVPLPGRLIVDEPRAVRQRVRSSGGLYLPEHSERTRRPRGLIARILRCAPDVAATFADEGVAVGAYVFIPEYAGVPLYATTGPTGYWVISAGEVIAVVESIDSIEWVESDSDF